MTGPKPGSEQPYRVDEAWSRAAFASRTGAVAAFLQPHLRPGIRLVDCGCGPGSITVDLAQAVAPGEVVGIDVRPEAVAGGRALARERGIANVTFEVASVYELPYPDRSFDAAFACAVLQHLAAPLAALSEIRRVLRPGGVLGIVDGSSPAIFRYPTNPRLEAYDALLGREREHNTGRPARALHLRTLLHEAGFERSEASGMMGSELGPPAGTAEEARRLAQHQLIRLRGVRSELALAQGWATPDELAQMADAVIAWGESPDAFYARPFFRAIAWA